MLLQIALVSTLIIIKNLLIFIGGNAFKYTSNGSVTIRLYADKLDTKEIVVLEVSDTGFLSILFYLIRGQLYQFLV